MSSSHTRSKPRPTTIDEYIAACPKDIAGRLRTIRTIVKKTAPDAKEVISYAMPAFKLNGLLLYFAAHKHHIGLYPYPSAMKAFQKESAQYKTGRGSIQFPHDKPLPLPLLRKIITFRVKEKLVKNKKA